MRCLFIIERRNSKGKTLVKDIKLENTARKSLAMCRALLPQCIPTLTPDHLKALLNHSKVA